MSTQTEEARRNSACRICSHSARPLRLRRLTTRDCLFMRVKRRAGETRRRRSIHYHRSTLPPNPTFLPRIPNLIRSPFPRTTETCGQIELSKIEVLLLSDWYPPLIPPRITTHSTPNSPAMQGDHVPPTQARKRRAARNPRFNISRSKIIQTIPEEKVRMFMFRNSTLPKYAHTDYRSSAPVEFSRILN
jgi:hypothetical protein